MQDRYAGDIGDYGKFGFLRAVERTGLSVGVNWYLTFPKGREKLQEDGRYLIAQKYFSCDQQLASSLYKISMRGSERTVEELERAALLESAIYYRKPVLTKDRRTDWHKEALQRLSPAKVVFLDPDNGLQVKSVGKNSGRAVKYIFEYELLDYLAQGQAVIFYQHRPRRPSEVYFTEMEKRIRSVCVNLNIQIMVLTFPKCTVRDYFIICPNGNFEKEISAAMSMMLQGLWGQMGIVKRNEI